MGEYITIGDSLLITVFSMVVVFVVLAAISYLIDLLRIVTNKEERKTSLLEEKNIDKIKKTSEVKEEKVVDSTEDEELVAVIAAAIAASIGVDTVDINIKSIRRVAPSQPKWAEVGRMEYINSKL